MTRSGPSCGPPRSKLHQLSQNTKQPKMPLASSRSMFLVGMAPSGDRLILRGEQAHNEGCDDLLPPPSRLRSRLRLQRCPAR